ncbi:hypothetical protein CKA37_08540 [Pseudomonas aeruginosa]|nr:hypothetical protein AM489_14100 [Pseudomonas aeruginosa]AWT28851.1 hypothetical protein DCS61_07185 [Pseudomonas aeruginosa]AXZ94968.1 hypothetical protein AM490_31600 [Pseudomonas aeruginosa]MCO1754912.1 hypothetical protein [Pseudomonas aeruginosa]MDV6425013.1 hypothetical protein [Pseudomonas aeruginosa]
MPYTNPGKRSAQAHQGRRRQGLKPDGRDSAEARGAAREPDGGTLGRLIVCSRGINDTAAQMGHNVATAYLEVCHG